MKTLTILVVLLALAPLSAATITDPIQNDAGSGGDAGDSQATATTLRNGQPGAVRAAGTYAGLMVALDDPRDFYRFDAPAVTEVTLTLSVRGMEATCRASEVSLGRVQISLIDPAGQLADSTSADGPCATKLLLRVPGSATAGTWHIVLAYSSGDSPLGVPIPTAASGGLSATAEYELTLGCKPYC